MNRVSISLELIHLYGSKEFEKRSAEYTIFCNYCLKELPEDAVCVLDEQDEDRKWYNYFCSDNCALYASLLSHTNDGHNKESVR